MAESAAVSFLLENAAQLAKEYADLINDADHQLKQLQNELGSLKAFLADAAKVPDKDQSFTETERQIREAVYEVEDTIDSCLTHAAVANDKNYLCRVFNTKSVSLAKEVKYLREKKVIALAKQAREDKAKMSIPDGSSTSGEQSFRKVKEAYQMSQDEVVGFEEDEEFIIGALKEEKEKLDIIAIVGMAGSGKTTLVSKIFKNENIQSEFPTRIWVSVSQDFNEKDVLVNIVKELTGGSDTSSMSDQALATAVQTSLANRKFLLVMDDVWTTENWNAIKQVLPMNNWKGKVLITSRDKIVGAKANPKREPHELCLLSPDESWELLRLAVFGELNGCPRNLRWIGEYISSRCGGLPLKIVVVGGILQGKLMSSKAATTSLVENEWLEVSDNLSANVADHRQMLKVVELSYNILPDDLKSCFLYLGVFPEDYEIPVWTLTRLWIAEGFIQRKEGQSLEETAYRNLKDLVDKNLVIVGKTSRRGQIKTCRVQDVIRQFCIFKANFDEQNLFQEIINSKEGVFEPPVPDVHKYRRLCIRSDLPTFVSKILSAKVKGQGVRSFICFSEPIGLDPQHVSTFLNSFKLLRVLDSKSIKFTQFPTKAVTKLIHIRYLTLTLDTELDCLPESLSELWNLQTLVVDTMSDILKIKANIWKMIQLRHIKITKAAIVLSLHGEGTAGENLQTLSRLSPDCCKEDVFKRARNLKRLGIRGRLAILLDDRRSLAGLNRLEHLKLVNNSTSGLSASNDSMPRLPPLDCFPPNIKKLTLSGMHLNWTHMSTLGMIATLQVLKLKDYAFSGKSWRAVGSGFPSLQFLLIGTTDLVFWEAPSGHFPRLTWLVLMNCVELRQIPLGLAKSLEKLEIEHAKCAVGTAKEIEEEKKRMREQNPELGELKVFINPPLL